MGAQINRKGGSYSENKMNIKSVTESVGLSAKELRKYLIHEIDEFLAAETVEDQQAEFHDIIFALKNMAYAHTSNHLEIDSSIYKNKIKNRLKEYATISKKKPVFGHNSIMKVPIGVVHLAFGNFKQPWSHFDSFKNGTEAEIVMLTDNEFGRDSQYTNHLILTFDDVDELEYTFLASSWNQNEKNTVLCRIPDFIYREAKNKNNLSSVNHLLSLQVSAAIKQISLKNDAIFHFHSWESGLAIGSKEFGKIVKGKKKFFSPYLTVARLRDFLAENNRSESTLSKKEMDLASSFERELVNFCDLSIVESENDKQFYEKFGGDVKKYSYSEGVSQIVRANAFPSEKLEFVTGGRPVYEKGFVQLLEELPEIIKYAKEHGLDFNLKVFCRDKDRVTSELKKPKYLRELEETINNLGIGEHVSILDKVSINNLRDEIRNSSGLIVPSLYDPYCLMPHYAIFENKISFVSKHTGISENIKSKDYVFDPKVKGSLLESIKKWAKNQGDFILENQNRSHKLLYKNGNRQ